MITVEALGYTRAEVLSFEDKENNTALHSSVNSGYPEVNITWLGIRQQCLLIFGYISVNSDLLGV